MDFRRWLENETNFDKEIKNCLTNQPGYHQAINRLGEIPIFLYYGTMPENAESVKINGLAGPSKAPEKGILVGINHPSDEMPEGGISLKGSPEEAAASGVVFKIQTNELNLKDLDKSPNGGFCYHNSISADKLIPI